MKLEIVANRGSLGLMGKRHHHRQQSSEQPNQDWDSERTLAAAEADQSFADEASDQTRCICGSSQFLLEAYLEVTDGRTNPEPVEVESLTCPRCGREYEAIVAEDGRVSRGDFLGTVELED